VHGQQVYQCKKCTHRFFNNGQLNRMKVKKHVVVAALNLYFDGLSVRKTQKQLDQLLGEQVNSSTIYRWLVKYSALVSQFCESEMNPQTSRRWHEDETMITVRKGGVTTADGEKNHAWFWEMIDEETRFLVASHLSGERTIDETTKIFEKSVKVTKERPITVYVDGSNAYDRAFNKVFWTIHKSGRPYLMKRVGIKARETNNIVERLHGTLKDRLKPMRGLKSEKTAKILLDGYVINYNYIRKHQAIRKTPAQAAGIDITNGWSELIDRATEDKTKDEMETKRIALIEVKA
ncbi:MAG: IS6 family transposase, partial [Nitrososphaerales archaeon]